MLFMTRKRFEEEVQKEVWREEDRRLQYNRIGELSDRLYKLEHEVRELRWKLEGNEPAEKTCDAFFVDCGNGDIKPV